MFQTPKLQYFFKLIKDVIFPSLGLAFITTSLKDFQTKKELDFIVRNDYQEKELEIMTQKLQKKLDLFIFD